MFLIKRIYLSEVAGLINRRDVRAVKTWCRKNNLQVFSDTSGDFVFEHAFVLAYEMPLIQALKKEHVENWEQVYEAYKNNTLYKMLDSVPTSKTTVERYVPKGKVALSLMKKYGL